MGERTPTDAEGADVLWVAVPDARFADLWPDGGGPASPVVWDLIGPPPCEPRLLVTPYARSGPRFEWLGRLPSLEVVQTLSAGVDYLAAHVPEGVTLCNAAGVHEAGTAELAVGLALTALRGVGRYRVEELTETTWPPPFRPSLADRRVLVVGAGRIGNALVERLLPFEVRLTRVASTAREDELGEVLAVSDLPSLLPRHEVVFLTLPLTPQTRHLVDKDFLAALPDGALLVNVGRGPLVDTAALVAEVTSGRLSAALDVTDPEPLPPGHPLLSCPNVVLTPHVGGASTAFFPRARALLREQVERLATGRPQLNVVSGPERRG